MSRKIIAPNPDKPIHTPCEYHVVVDAEGKISVTRLTDIPDSSRYPDLELWNLFNQRYSHKSYIYIARHISISEPIVYKIGVSKDPDERMSKLSWFVLIHEIECDPDYVFRLEKTLHGFFAPCHEHNSYHGNELFLLDTHPEYDFLEMLKLIKTDIDLRDWLKRMQDHIPDINRGWRSLSIENQRSQRTNETTERSNFEKLRESLNK